MLQEILNEAREALIWRGRSSTVYCGWGTILDNLMDDYLSMGGSWTILKKIIRLAEGQASYVLRRG